MKITIAITTVLLLTAGVNSYWDQFWSQFKFQHVVTQDCGKIWRLYDFDTPVPEAGGNPCYIKEQVPKAPIHGNNIGFMAKLGQNVEMNMGISYEYEIIDPVKYVENVSRIAQHVSTRSVFPEDGSVWESVKALYIDRVLHEVASSPEVLQANGVGDTQQEGLSDRVIKHMNTRLYEWGIRLTRVLA